MKSRPNLPQMFYGYYCNAEATTKCWTDDGYYRTNDYCRIERAADGRRILYCLDRASELLKLDGANSRILAPSDLEEKVRNYDTRVMDVGVLKGGVGDV